VQIVPAQNVYVPGWLVERRIVDSSGRVREYDDYEGHHVIISDGGSVMWEFTMPVGPEGGTAQSLEVNVVADSRHAPGPSATVVPGMAGAKIEVLNRATGRWEAVPLAGPRGTIPNPAQAMAEDGTVQVRLSASGAEVGLRTMTMSGTVHGR
jgi:hypothetical protein